MKKIFLALLLAIALLSCSKNTDHTEGNIPASQVPSAVMMTYNARYPAAAGQVEWEKEDGNTFKVKFFIGGQRWQAIFKADGTLLSEQPIS